MVATCMSVVRSGLVARLSAALAFAAALIAAPAHAAPATMAATMAPASPPAPAIAAAASVPPVAVIPLLAAPIALPTAAPMMRATPSLHDLVIAYVDRGDQDEEEQCLAEAVFFEARGEPLEGQLAVAQVVLNRAASGTFPPSICAVVTQPAQFSFVRHGRMPPADRSSECWHRALAIADIARRKALAGEIAADVLWYHASYVSPAWGRQRTRIATIGGHIFYS